MSVASPPLSACLCDSLRQATRTVTRLYDDALRPVELRITQFSILAQLAREGEARVRDLGNALLLEETTLTRSLRPLEERGWVAIRAGDDRRERHVAISAEGRKVLARAAPLWQAVQSEMRERLGEPAWNTLFRALPKAAHAAQEA